MLIRALLICLLFCSCASTKIIETDLYFGQTIPPENTVISDAQWNSFKDNHIARVFTKGSTTIKAVGTWYDPDAKQLITEPSYMVSNFHENSKRVSMQIDSLRELYKKMFNQQSVLRVDRKVKLVSF